MLKCGDYFCSKSDIKDTDECRKSKLEKNPNWKGNCFDMSFGQGCKECGGKTVKASGDVREWIHDKLANGEDVPEYLWAAEGKPHFSIDLKDVISEKCEDGYEDMYSNLDTVSPLISQAQELINQWEKEQGESLCLFSETYKKAVIIKDLIAEIEAEIKELTRPL